MRLNRVFYTIKPLIPRRVQIALRRQLAAYKRPRYAHIWPIDPNSATPPEGWRGWPEGKKFALVLSHDVDTAEGYKKVLDVAALEERLGFRSTFNFVPERYGKISLDLLDGLRRRGFGVGVHGLKHDGKLFLSERTFNRQARRINAYLKEWKTGGFTSPSMHRNLDWMIVLNIRYSTSTFDTDPFEPQPDGVGTIFPFVVYQKGAPSAEPDPEPDPGNSEPGTRRLAPSPESQGSGTQNTEPRFFVELPYTLPQDSTLFIILREGTIDIWKRKLDWIAEKGGMALLNTHPDYMKCGPAACGLEEYPMAHYEEFLGDVKRRHEGRYWHGLSEQMACFWIEEFAAGRIRQIPNRTGKPESIKARAC